jgi:general stress protein CsbA
MATDTIPHPQIVRRDRPANTAWDRIFFSTMIVLLWASVLFGFAKTYFLAGMVRAPLPNRLIHIHGAVFTLWMVLLLVQETLIVGKKVRWHKTLGLAGFGLAIAMVVLGLLAATDALRRGSAPPGLTAKTFYVVPISVISMFALLVYLAYKQRFKPAAHKRLILIATIAISNAAVARWPIAVFETNPLATTLAIAAFLLLVVAYDLLSLHRVHKATLWASLLVMVVLLVRIPIAFSHPWQAFATFMQGKS